MCVSVMAQETKRACSFLKETACHPPTLWFILNNNNKRKHGSLICSGRNQRIIIRRERERRAQMLETKPSKYYPAAEVLIIHANYIIYIHIL
jgi:hypothetical protein